MLQKIMKIRMDEISIYLAVAIIGFVFGNILLAGLNFIDVTEGEVFPLGIVMAIGFTIMVTIIMGMLHLPQLFYLEIGFGVSRKRFFIYDVLVSLIWNMIMVVVFIGLNVLDNVILRNIYSSKNEMVEFYLIHYIPWIILVVICITILRELLGSLILKYGPKGYVVIWFFYMMCCLVPQRFAHYASEGERDVLADIYNSISDWFFNLGIKGYGIMGIIFTVVALGISWLIIRKQALKA